MNDFFTWMMDGGPHAYEHDQRVSHLVALQDARDEARAARPSLVERIRSRFAPATRVERLDCCTAA